MPGVQEINRNDLGVMIAGVVAFIASFLPYVGASASFAGVHVSSNANAWHSYAVLGLLLMFAAAIIIAVKTFASMPTLPVGLHVLAAALAAVGTLLVIIRGFTVGNEGISGVDVGVRWGGYILFIAGIAETVFALLGMRESGEKVPWQQGGGSATPPPPPAAPPA